MRNFNSFEQKVLRHFYKKSKENEHLVHLFHEFKLLILENRGLWFEENQTFITFSYDRKKDLNAPKELINYLTLIDYLANEGLIVKMENEFTNYNPKDFFSYNLKVQDGGIVPIKGKWNKESFIPQGSVTFPKIYLTKILSLSNQEIFLTADLEILIQENFQTNEMKTLNHTEKQTKLSFSALILSFLTLFLTWYLMLNPDRKQVNNNDDQSVITPIKETQTDLDSIKTSRFPTTRSLLQDEKIRVNSNKVQVKQVQ
jgi:hypothetical protein